MGSIPNGALPMSHTPHELADDFPESAERLRALNASSAHFAKLCDDYHEVNRQVHRMETSAEPAGEAVEALMRRKRMMLKDGSMPDLRPLPARPSPHMANLTIDPLAIAALWGLAPCWA